MRQTLDQGVHRLEIAKMLGVLEQAGLIKRVCGAAWGLFGTGWRAIAGGANAVGQDSGQSRSC